MNCVSCETAMPAAGAAFCPDCAMVAPAALPELGLAQRRSQREDEHGQDRVRGLSLRRLSPAEQVVALASLAIVAALFLPWFSGPGIGTSTSSTGLAAHGYLALTVVTGLGLPGYLLLRAARVELATRLPVPHTPLLLAGTALQLILIVGAFIARPAASNWDAGALLALAAALTACAVTVGPVLRAAQPPC
jgi:hypothetical protein